MKGLVMHSYHRCNDKDSTLFKEDGKRTARAEAGFETLLDSYLIDILQDTAPKDIVAVWEGGNDRRIELFPGYKKKRREAEKDPVVEGELKKMYKYTKTFLAGMGCIQLKYPFAEGDDALAFLSTKMSCSIHTIDGDLIQLASDTCMVTQKDEVKETDEHGTPPHLIALRKSIVGDTSDEYPGVKGLGKVAWEKLVEEFGIDGMEELDQLARDKNLDELEAISAEAGSKALTTIADAKYQWLLQYELARLHPEWCENTYKKTIIRPEIFKRLPNRGRVEEVLTSCGCMDFMPQLDRYLPHNVLVTADNVDAIIYDGDFLDDFNDSIVAFDYESYDTNKFENFVKVMQGKPGTYVDVLSQKITGASFTWGANLNKTIYICFDHADTNNCDIEVLRDLLDNAGELVCQNDGFEYVVTANTFGIEEAGRLLQGTQDTRIMASYVDENERTGLKHSSLKYLNYHQATYKETLGDKEDMSQLTGEEVFNYGIDDAICTAHLYSLGDFVMTIEGTRDFCRTYEADTNRVVSDAFMEGCNISLPRLEKMRDEDQKDLDVLWPRLRELLAANCTEEHPDRADIYMAEIRKFEVAKMTEAGKTDEEIAVKLADMREKFTTGSKYVPYTEAFIRYEFKPTKAQLNAARRRLWIVKEEITLLEGDLTETIDEFEIGSVATSRISEWAASMIPEELPEEQQEFVDLVAAAAHQFKIRAGDEFKALSTYVQKLFPERDKVTTSGDELSLDSPTQMAHLLYGKLGLPIRVATKVQMGSTRDRLGFQGGPAANDKAIETALAEDLIEHDWRREVIESVREIKSLETMFKLYYTPYPLWIRPDTGKVHPGIINCGTATRRPTGTQPNLLQVKKGKIRSMFLPMREGHVLIAPDFSGQELRILGSESGDPVIYDAYMGENRKDIHSLTASAIMPAVTQKLRPDLMSEMKLTPDRKAMDYDQFMEWRSGDNEDLAKHANFVRNKRAKACNFLVNYEGGAGTLSTNILVPRDEAKKFIGGMLGLYKGIVPFQEKAHDDGRAYGYVKTAYGSRRHATNDILSKDDSKRMRMERQLSNFIIQGTAADILKVVMSSCLSTDLLKDTQSFIMAPVYDEVVCSVPVKHATEFCQRLQAIMDLLPPGHTIPMVSEFSLGFDWYNMVEFGTDTSKEAVTKALAEAAELQEVYGE